MKSSFCIDLQRFMLIPTKFPLTPLSFVAFAFAETAFKVSGTCSYGSVAPFFSFCRAVLMLLSKLFAPVETPFFLSVKNRLLKVCKKFGRVVFIHYFRWRKDK